jgi:hypothetical protein
MRNIEATGQIFGQTVTLKQISKAKAKKLFAEGKTIYLQSSNMRPFGVWQTAMNLTLDTDQIKAEEEHYNFCKTNGLQLPTHPPTAGGQFDERINNYSFYNCDSERGKYINFYEAI